MTPINEGSISTLKGLCPSKKISEGVLFQSEMGPKMKCHQTKPNQTKPNQAAILPHGSMGNV